MGRNFHGLLLFLGRVGWLVPFWLSFISLFLKDVLSFLSSFLRELSFLSFDGMAAIHFFFPSSWLIQMLVVFANKKYRHTRTVFYTLYRVSIRGKRNESRVSALCTLHFRNEALSVVTAHVYILFSKTTFNGSRRMYYI